MFAIVGQSHFMAVDFQADGVDIDISFDQNLISVFIRYFCSYIIVLYITCVFDDDGFLGDYRAYSLIYLSL
ncbi:hypothetical protein [Photobacterium nomapromontoriensis]|uniref:hypothetical protein n=1 Tax=Photobacterium nomapromontoriensis TaxID=2910237 RepID=UPI003D0D14EE